MHDLHESEWFLYTYSGQAPQNTLFDPILWGELPWFSDFEMSQLTKYGMPDVWTHGYVNGWSPGYVAIMSANHNGMMRMYEIMGNGGATTMHRFIPETKPELKGSGGVTGDVSKKTMVSPFPSLSRRRLVDAQQHKLRGDRRIDGAAAYLGISTTHTQKLLHKSKNSIHSGETQPPYGFIIPGDQEDMTRVAFVIKILRMQGIEVGRAHPRSQVKGRNLPCRLARREV
jgi:hypothetical protein